jgi:hypothetical protein
MCLGKWTYDVLAPSDFKCREQQEGRGVGFWFIKTLGEVMCELMYVCYVSRVWMGDDEGGEDFHPKLKMAKQ